MKPLNAVFAMALIFAAPLPAAADAEFYADVMPLVEANCITCHSNEGVSFSFENAEQVYALRMAIVDAVGNNRMPPFLAEHGHQDYVDDFSLTADEKRVIADWAAAGFPKTGSAMASADQAEEFVFHADLSLPVLPVEAYLPNQDRKDDYRCFVVEWPYDTDTYVTGFMANPGNLRVAHHLVSHAVGPEGADLLKILSEEEEGPGHQCFGGALPDRLGDKAVRDDIEARFPGALDELFDNTYWLTHWAPGMYGLSFPENSGVLVRPGSLIVVQMHYYSAFAPGESDSNTTMHFQVATQVDRPSVNYPLTLNEWLDGEGNGSMVIPPGESQTYEISESLADIADYAARKLKIDPEAVTGVELQSANVHMHDIGASGRTSLLDSNGRKHTLLNIPRWDLNWQRDFMFTQGKVIPRAEFDDTRLIVECVFSNYKDFTVYGGFGSDDEMCFDFSYVSIIRGDDAAVAARDH